MDWKWNMAMRFRYLYHQLFLLAGLEYLADSAYIQNYHNKMHEAINIDEFSWPHARFPIDLFILMEYIFYLNTMDDPKNSKYMFDLLNFLIFIVIDWICVTSPNKISFRFLNFHWNSQPVDLLDSKHLLVLYI